MFPGFSLDLHTWRRAGWPLKREWCCGRKLNHFTPDVNFPTKVTDEVSRRVETAARRGNGMQAFSVCVYKWQWCCLVCWDHTATMTYQFLGLGERVLHIREAEAGHGDELTHHRHKLVAQLLRSLLLVFQLLRLNIFQERKLKGQWKECYTRPALNIV